MVALPHNLPPLTADTPASPPDVVHAAQSAGWPDQAELLRWAHDLHPGVATALLVAGGAFLAFGYCYYRYFMAVNFAVLGAWLGVWLGGMYGQAIPGGVVGGVAGAAVCWPLMQWAVSITGATLGAIGGVYVWRAYGLDPGFAWSGGAIGGVFCGMLAFALFRGSVMLFTAVQGAAMLVFGALGLLYQVSAVAPTIDRSGGWPYALPIAVFVPAVVGLLYQHAGSRQQALPPK